MNPITELSEILNSVHNVNSTATNPVEFEDIKQPETLFDKLVLRWV